MRITTRFRSFRTRSGSLVGALTAAFVLVSPSGRGQGLAPEIQPGEKTSFQEVTRYLNPGGDAYVYLSTAEWGRMLVDKLQELKEMFLGTAQDPSARKNIEAGFQLADRILRDLGLLEIDAFGMSSVASEPGLYHQRAIVYHRPGNDKGLVWRMFGRESTPLDELKLLPARTVLASFCRVDFNLAWTWWKDLAAGSGFPKLEQSTAQLPQTLRAMGADLDLILASLEGPVGIVVTMDPEKPAAIPGPTGQPIQVPAPAVMLVAKVKNDALYRGVQRSFATNPNVVRVDEADLKMLTIPVRSPIPITVRPTLALAKGYFFLASTDQLVRDALAVLAGATPGLTQSDTFKKLSRNVPDKGVAFQYLDPAFMEAWGKISSAMMQGMQRAGRRNAARAFGPMMAMQALVAGKKPLAVYKVGQIGPAGRVTIGNSTMSASAMAGNQLIGFPITMMVAGALPAITQARSSAKRAACMSNLKQIGLGLMMYAQDHNETFPDDPELLTPYLGTPSVWGCPARPNPAQDAEHSDYVYLGGGLRLPEIPKPSRTVIVHDKPGNHPDGMMCFLFADGHVQAVRAASVEEAVRKNGWRVPGL